MTTKVEKSITVDVPVSTAYNQWTQFEEFPRFMGGVQSVEQLGDTRLHWVAEIGGVKREWNADILEQRVDEKVAWAATEGATNAGAVYFTPTGATQTLVRLELEYEPEGLLEKVGDALSFIERQATSDLEKFKKFIESKGVESGAWRGEVPGAAVGTPGVEDATSHGDSGKAGISGKAAAAGVAAAAAGVAAAVAAAKSGDDTDSEVTVTEAVVPADAPVAVPPVVPVDVPDDTGAHLPGGPVGGEYTGSEPLSGEPGVTPLPDVDDDTDPNRPAGTT
jgi:carbon monoxide dehydrogenase subunit G